MDVGTVNEFVLNFLPSRRDWRVVHSQLGCVFNVFLNIPPTQCDFGVRKKLF